MTGDQVSILDGNTFVVSDRRGDIDAGGREISGLFSYDTRFLSRWVLTIDGQRLRALSVDDLQYFESRFFLVPHTGTIYVDATMSVIRRRAVGHGFHEEVRILNHSGAPVDLRVRIDADSDFADLFEVKNSQQKQGRTRRAVEQGCLRLSYERGTFHRETCIRASQPGRVDSEGFEFAVHIEPHGVWASDLEVVTALLGWGERHARPKYRHAGRRARPVAEDLRAWLDNAPTLETDREGLEATYRRSLVDLAALRFSPPVAGGASLPAAGLPWFMTLLGRDSIFTSLQALPFAPELAATTLRALGSWQGVRVDDFREEEPGRIPHEIRYGETAAFEEQPHSPYYGTADATALFVVLLDEYERWTGDRQLVRQEEAHARAALAWVDTYADRAGNGYVSYQRANTTTGLENQCWKDSWEAISYHDGRLPGYPRATCELQGYSYDAKVRAARLARAVWHDDDYARELEDQATRLKRRFNRDFWIAEGGFFAVALEPDGTQVDSLSSNIGHLLWSGIVDRAKARAVVRHLLSPRMFTGWGVRTLADSEARYNPIGYHVGTVWPFDNSIIAWGLRRYGFKAEAARVAAGILDAAEYFEGRLPEAFAGYDREDTGYPVEYPTACSPQSWSTGAPLLLLRTMLGLSTSGNFLVTDPAVPEDIGYLALLNIRGRWGKVDAFGRGREHLTTSAHPRPHPFAPRPTEVGSSTAHR